jgi:hypothetical protein
MATYPRVISPYQTISSHPQGLPVGSAAPQVEQVEEEKQHECEENWHGEDERLVQFELRRYGRAVVWWIWGRTRHGQTKNAVRAGQENKPVGLHNP